MHGCSRQYHMEYRDVCVGRFEDGGSIAAILFSPRLAEMSH